MRLIIWGTGFYYEKYSPFINFDDILFLVDRNPEKWNSQINGIGVVSPEEILKEEFDYIVIFVKQNKEIVLWLKNHGIKNGKIKDTFQFLVLYHPEIKLSSRNILLSDWMNASERKKVAVVTPFFSRTGVPVALKNLSILLQKMNLDVLLLGFGREAMIDDMKSEDLDFISGLELYSFRSSFMDELERFNVIILGSLVLAEFGFQIGKLHTSILWWIHESDEMFYKDCKISLNNQNIHYYGVGQRVMNQFKKYFPTTGIKELLYCLPDVKISKVKDKDKDKKKRRFVQIGSICHLKGQDLLVSALMKLSREYMDKIEVYIVGKEAVDEEQKIKDLSVEISGLYFVEELSQEQINELYKNVDILVCPSRGDSMPIVVTQAFQNAVPCIISDQVGQVAFYDEEPFGKIFKTEDVEELQECLEYFIGLSDEEMEVYARNARTIYERYFTEEVIREKILDIFQQEIPLF